MHNKLTVYVRAFITVVSLLFCSQVHANGELPEDPLNSIMWTYMAERYFPGEVVIDQRVIVQGPLDAEDQMQVPITVDATQLENVEEIVALADLNPIPHILTLRPTRAQPFIGFRVKLEQATPIRVGVRTSDGVWHVNGVYVTMRMKHPMDTGLAPGIPVFYMNKIEVTSPQGAALAELELFEPISENPTLTLKPLVSDNIDELIVHAGDTEANEFHFSLPVPATADN